MDESTVGNGQSPDEEPSFVFGGNYVVSEDNWLELASGGVANVIESISRDDADALRSALEQTRELYGDENLLLGDAYDAEADRALKHKPGIGIYVTPDGLEHYEQMRQKQAKRPPVVILPDGRQFDARPGRHIDPRPGQPAESRDE